MLEAANAKQPVPFVFDYTYDAPGHPLQYYCRADHYSYARYGIPSVAFSRASIWTITRSPTRRSTSAIRTWRGWRRWCTTERSRSRTLRNDPAGRAEAGGSARGLRQ